MNEVEKNGTETMMNSFNLFCFFDAFSYFYICSFLLLRKGRQIISAF